MTKPHIQAVVTLHIDREMVTSRRGYVQNGRPKHEHVRRCLHPKTRGTNSNPAGPPSGLAVAGELSVCGISEEINGKQHIC